LHTRLNRAHYARNKCSLHRPPSDWAWTAPSRITSFAVFLNAVLRVLRALMWLAAFLSPGASTRPGKKARNRQSGEAERSPAQQTDEPVTVQPVECTVHQCDQSARFNIALRRPFEVRDGVLDVDDGDAQQPLGLVLDLPPAFRDPVPTIVRQGLSPAAPNVPAAGGSDAACGPAPAARHPPRGSRGSVHAWSFVSPSLAGTQQSGARQRARTLLRVIAREPDVVIRALARG